MSAQPYQPSALSDVTVSVDGDDTVVSFPRVLPYSVEKVWEAITDPEMLAQWTPYTADRNLSRTGDAVITMLTEDGAPEMSLPVTVHVVETTRRLEHEWGPDELVWDLTPIEGRYPRRADAEVARRGDGVGARCGVASVLRRTRCPSGRRALRTDRG